MSSRDIKERFDRVRSRPDGVIVFQRTGSDHVIVTKDDGQIILFFGDPRDDTTKLNLSGVMSRVLLRDPLYLLGIYTRVMMLALAWCPDPKHAYLLGFGGGRMPMVLHAHYGDVISDSTETEEIVVRLAQQYFGVILDERMRVFVEDGRSYLENRPNSSYNIIWIDCFNGSGQHPFHLSTVEFYEVCKLHLQAGGVVVTNLSPGDDLLSRKIATFSHSFRMSAVYHDKDQCCVLFGWEDEEVTIEDIKLSAQKVEETQRFSFPFAAYAKDLIQLSTETLDEHLLDAHAVDILQSSDTLFLGVGRNESCPCGSGKKYKQCHGSRK